VKLTSDQVAHIVREVEALEYGKVTLYIDGQRRLLDVVVERRTRYREAPGFSPAPDLTGKPEGV
jgi:hypothetical protein